MTVNPIPVASASSNSPKSEGMTSCSMAVPAWVAVIQLERTRTAGSSDEDPTTASVP